MTYTREKIEKALAHLTTADKVLGAHIAKVPFTLTTKSTESIYAALAESIVYQQLSGKAAATIFGRVEALFPRGKLEPRLAMKVTDDALRGAGLSRPKLAALRDLSERAAKGSIPSFAKLATMEDEEIVERLTEVRGIGRWTVQMILIFRLGRPDVLPVADLGVKKGFARLFHGRGGGGKAKDELPTDEALEKRADRWRPYRSVASWYLWRACEL